jgi:predicted RNase H-like HicB family nuclease
MTCVIEKTPTGYSAYIEEVPGCLSAGATLEEVARLTREQLCLYFENDPNAVPLVFKSRGRWLMVESCLPIAAPYAVVSSVRTR